MSGPNTGDLPADADPPLWTATVEFERPDDTRSVLTLVTRTETATEAGTAAISLVSDAGRIHRVGVWSGDDRPGSIDELDEYADRMLPYSDWLLEQHAVMTDADEHH